MIKRDWNLLHPKEQIVIIINKIYKKSLTTTSGGNISILDDNGDIWVTPSGIDKGSLTVNDIMCVKANGEIIGPHKPSMEYRFHQAIYKLRPELKSVVHAHPPGLVAFSIIRKTPNTKIVSKINEICGNIGYADYKLPGSIELGEAIAKPFAQGAHSVIMENHGAVVAGTSLIDAFERFEMFEFAANTIINANIIGKPINISDENLKNKNKAKLFNKNTFTNDVVSNEEKLLRKQICEFAVRAYNQNLMFCKGGSISARINDDEFLITPENIPSWDLKPSDIVKVKQNATEENKVPSDTINVHNSIYDKNSDVNCILFSQPIYLMAHAVSHTKVDTRTIPESWIFLQDIKNITYSEYHSDYSCVAENISKDSPGLIIENETFVMTGTSILSAFDRLEVAEFSAKSLIIGKSLGKFVPMNDNEIQELKKAFF